MIVVINTKVTKTVIARIVGAKMKIGGLIVGNGIGEIVRDGRTLRAMSKAGNFEYPITKGQPYVDEKDKPRWFNYKGYEYRINYFDGCFFPFVVRSKSLNQTTGELVK